MYKKWRLKRALSFVSFLFTSGLKEIVSDEGLSSVFRVSVKTFSDSGAACTRAGTSIQIPEVPVG